MGCIESQTANPTPVRARVPPPKKQYRRISRMSTKFKLADLRQITDDQRHGGYSPCYACPICFIYYNKILACSSCTNFICYKCFIAYEKKTKQNLKCPFCSSGTSTFIDHELQAHSYFDSTNNGFISKEQRSKIDREMQGPQKSKIQQIQQARSSILAPIAEQNNS